MGELAKAIAVEVDAYIKTMTITIASGFFKCRDPRVLKKTSILLL